MIKSDSGDLLLRVDVFMYNMICFLRYGVYQKDFALKFVPPDSTNKTVVTKSEFYLSDVRLWKSGNTYLAALETYLHYFALSNNSQISNWNSQSELFLWLIVDYWIDVILVINKDLSSNVSRDSNRLSHSLQSGPSLNFKSPADLALLDPNGSVPSPACLQCIYLLLMHLQENAMSNSKKSTLFFSVFCSNNSDNYISRSEHKNSSSTVKNYSLARSLEMLQRPMYDLLRTLFSK